MKFHLQMTVWKMAKRVVILLGIALSCAHVTGGNKYDNYTLLQITPHDAQQLRALKHFFSSSLHRSDELDVMKNSHGLEDNMDVLVSPEKLRLIVRFAKSHAMPVKIIKHYGRFLESRSNKTKLSRGFKLFDYNSYETIRQHLQFIRKNKKHLVKLKHLGKSYQGRNIYLLQISADHEAKNPVIFIDAGAHAREWAAPAMSMYLINRLTTGALRELDGVDWYILPVTNPDGYEYSRQHPSQRLWRKTRSKTKTKGCFGVDINRNYGYKWGVSGVDFDPCNPYIYPGEAAFSEAETRIVRKVMKTYSDRIKLYVSIHSYGHYLVYPWGYTGEYLPTKWKSLHKLALSFSAAVKRVGGKPLNVMSAGQWYPSAGGSDDYAFGEVKIPYSYTLEVTDGHQFSLPSALLNTVLPQYYEGFKAFGREIKKMYGKKFVISGE